MKIRSFFSTIVFLLIFVPQVAFAAWWNPLTWSVFSWIKIYPPQEQKISTTTSATTTKKAETKVAPESSSQNKPIPVKVAPVQTGTLCNGVYYSDCPTGNLLVCPTNGDKASCQPLPNTVPAQTYTAPQKTQQDTQTKQNAIDQNLRYQQQLQIVENKIKALQPAFDQYMSVCPKPVVGGSEAIVCQAAFGKATAVGEYQNAIMNNFLTPVSDISIDYENKLDAISEQIYELKINYHQQVSSVSGGGVPIGNVNGRINQLTEQVNSQITALNQQWQFLLTDYHLKLLQ